MFGLPDAERNTGAGDGYRKRQERVAERPHDGRSGIKKTASESEMQSVSMQPAICIGWTLSRVPAGKAKPARSGTCNRVPPEMHAVEPFVRRDARTCPALAAELSARRLSLTPHFSVAWECET
jgi:hypothetical protein